VCACVWSVRRSRTSNVKPPVKNVKNLFLKHRCAVQTKRRGGAFWRSRCGCGFILCYFFKADGSRRMYGLGIGHTHRASIGIDASCVPTAYRGLGLVSRLWV
jgi:hypothetical protein